MAKWDTLLLDPFSVSTLPSPHVVKFIEKFKIIGQMKVLDMGCGRGRHSVYLAKQPGIDVFALDNTSVALKITQEAARKNKVTVKIVKADVTSLPFQDCFFDGVIAINVINHNTINNVRKSLTETRRVLKNNGAFLLTLLSTRDFRCNLGDKIGPHTFILKNDPENGIVHTFFDKKMIRHLLRSFSIKEMFEERSIIRDGKISYRWIIEAIKTKYL